jgi:hypothetical protein
MQNKDPFYAELGYNVIERAGSSIHVSEVRCDALTMSYRPLPLPLSNFKPAT